MKEKMDKKRLLILIGSLLFTILAMIGIFVFSGKHSSHLHPQKGVLDLQNWQIEKDGVLSLGGEWDFYWNRFVDYEEIAGGSSVPAMTVHIPSVWNNYEIDGVNLPGFGYGTYLLRVINFPQGKPLALRIPTFSTAYELYIDNQLVSANGKVGTEKANSAPGYMPQVVEFMPAGKSVTLIFHVSNFIYARGGMWYALYFGTPEQIAKMDQTIADKDMFLFGALSVMAFYYLIIFLLRREDKSSLFYAFMCILFAVRTAIYGDYLIYRLVPFISFRALISISYITLCWFSVCAAFMVGDLFPEETSKKVLKAGLFSAMGMTLLFLFTPISFFTRWVNIVQWFAILFGAYSVYILSRSFSKGLKDAGIMLVGALVVIVCALHDVLYNNNIILSSVGELVPFSLFILLLMQSFVLSRRFSEAFLKVNTLSQQLIKSDKIKDEFLANTSHELRTPLSGIIGITEALLKGSEGELSSSQKQKLSLIAGSSRRLANLVNDILDYSRMKNGDILLDIRPLQIEGLIHTVVVVFQQLSRAKEYEVIYEIPENLPPVLADENRVVQILYNLVGNAAKFTVQGHIKIAAQYTKGMVEVSVSDTGQGIPLDKLEDIFKSFEQVDTSLTRRYGGTGLGLPITKHLMELMGGSIWVESQPGAGSRFTFTLPAADAVSIVSGDSPKATATLWEEPQPVRPEQELAAALETAPALTEIAKGEPRVLLVDDDMVNLQAAASILRLGGYGVTTSGSGKAALEQLAKFRDYSVVILDVMMPELSGYEVCRKIRENRSSFELPVLILTAKASTEDIVMGFEAGANDYLPKPYEPEELLARVRTLSKLKTSADRALAAETAFMQAQIKPHFLFNTLNAISSFCDSDPERAQRLIADFSDYLRQSFDFKSLEAYGSLEQELALVNSYIEIEKARFGEQLQVEFNIERSINIILPVLSIQPLVENAISHGLRKKGGKGTVILTVKRIAQDVWVCVEDNGQGILPDKLEGLLNKKTNRGIGLWNIDRRLRKLYGKGLTIESVPGQGTRVSYTIPSGGELL